MVQKNFNLISLGYRGHDIDVSFPKGNVTQDDFQRNVQYV